MTSYSRVRTLSAGWQVCNVPLDAVYAAPYELHFRPRDERYDLSKTVFKWKEQNKRGKVITCLPNTSDLDPIYFRVGAVFFSFRLTATQLMYTYDVTVAGRIQVVWQSHGIYKLCGSHIADTNCVAVT